MRRHTVALAFAVLVLGITVAFGSTPPRASAESRGLAADFTPVTTGFLPSRDGFSFRNVGPQPADNIVERATAGRCGGMTFAALDAFRANASLPVGAELERVLLKRSADSIAANIARFALWTLWPDHADGVRSGVYDLTREEELPLLARQLESGPVALGLVRARSLQHIGLNHQLVAYGMERRGDIAVVHVYDPDQPGSDEVTLELDLSDSSAMIEEYNGDWLVASWRGLFVEEYVAPAASR